MSKTDWGYVEKDIIEQMLKKMGQMMIKTGQMRKIMEQVITDQAVNVYSWGNDQADKIVHKDDETNGAVKSGITEWYHDKMEKWKIH